MRRLSKSWCYNLTFFNAHTPQDRNGTALLGGNVRGKRTVAHGIRLATSGTHHDAFFAVRLSFARRIPTSLAPVAVL